MEKLKYIVFFILLLPASSYGANTFNNSSSSPNISGVSSFSWSHTIGSDNDRLLIVGIRTNDPTNTALDVTGVKYNGVNMTKANDLIVGAGPYLNSEIWYMLEASLPSAGTYTVSITLAGAASQSRAIAAAFSNVKQAAPEATATKDCSAASSCTTSITTTSANAWLIDFIGTTSEVVTFTPGADQTAIELTGNLRVGSYKPVATAGATSAGWTFGATVTRVSHIVAAFAPKSDNFTPSSITTGEAFGSAVLEEIKVLEVVEIASAESFGTLAMGHHIQMNTQGIASGERVPLPFVWSQLTPDPSPVTPTLIEE